MVEGFYGRPFTPAGRRALIGLVSALPRPAWVYAPKDDPWHRLRWREPYPLAAWRAVRGAMDEASKRGVRFVFGISPWEFRPGEAGIASEKLARALGEGAGGVAILFDDIEHRPGADLAGRQARFALRAAGRLGVPVIVCPSVYCTAQAAGPGGGDYLERLARLIPPEWGIFWTGDDVIPPALGHESLETAQGLLGRAPVVWDNLLADDYTIRRVFLGTPEGRSVGRAHYFLNPSGTFRAAWEQLRGLLAVAGVEAPASPLDGPGLDLLRQLHWTPWACGPRGREVLEMLSGAAVSPDATEAAELLETMLGDLEDLLGRLQVLDGGIELAPLVHDTARFLSLMRKALSGPRRDRAGTIRRLLFERLPYEHPLAETVRGLAFPPGARRRG